jgi:hypothetical protein
MPEKLTKEEYRTALRGLYADIMEFKRRKDAGEAPDTNDADNFLFTIKQWFELNLRYNTEHPRPVPQWAIDMVKADLKGPRTLPQIMQLIEERFGK